MDYTDRINISSSPPAHWEESEEDPIAEWAAVRIRQIYPFWGENSITLHPSDIKYPFDTPESLRPPGRKNLERPWQNLAKVKSPLEQLKADNAKMENTLRVAIDGLSRTYGTKWRTSISASGHCFEFAGQVAEDPQDERRN